MTCQIIEAPRTRNEPMRTRVPWCRLVATGPATLATHHGCSSCEVHNGPSAVLPWAAWWDARFRHCTYRVFCLAHSRGISYPRSSARTHATATLDCHGVDAAREARALPLCSFASARSFCSRGAPGVPVDSFAAA